MPSRAPLISRDKDYDESFRGDDTPAVIYLVIWAPVCAFILAALCNWP